MVFFSYFIKIWVTEIGPSYGFGTSPRENAETKTMIGSLFFIVNVLISEETWITKIGEIGTLSWFWYFTLRGNRGNRDPFMVLALYI